MANIKKGTDFKYILLFYHKKQFILNKKGKITLNLYVRNTHSSDLSSLRGFKGEQKW